MAILNTNNSISVLDGNLYCVVVSDNKVVLRWGRAIEEKSTSQYTKEQLLDCNVNTGSFKDNSVAEVDGVYYRVSTRVITVDNSPELFNAGTILVWEPSKEIPPRYNVYNYLKKYPAYHNVDPFVGLRQHTTVIFCAFIPDPQNSFLEGAEWIIHGDARITNVITNLPITQTISDTQDTKTLYDNLMFTCEAHHVILNDNGDIDLQIRVKNKANGVLPITTRIVVDVLEGSSAEDKKVYIVTGGISEVMKLRLAERDKNLRIAIRFLDGNNLGDVYLDASI